MAALGSILLRCGSRLVKSLESKVGSPTVIENNTHRVTTINLHSFVISESPWGYEGCEQKFPELRKPSEVLNIKPRRKHAP